MNDSTFPDANDAIAKRGITIGESNLEAMFGHVFLELAAARPLG